MARRYPIPLQVILPVLAVLTGCVDQPMKEQKAGKSESTPVAWEGTVSGNGADCGVVINGSLNNPPNAKDGILVTLDRVIDAEFSIVHVPEANGNVIIKTIGAEATNRAGAADYIKTLIAPGAALQLYRAGEACDVKAPGGGLGSMGTLILPDGRSLTELLILEGYLKADSSSSYCSGNVIEKCYEALGGMAVNISPYSITNFLWKPVSYSDSKLAILNYAPWAKISISGAVYDNPQHNVMIRMPKPGCAYGRATLKYWDEQGRIMPWPGGKLEWVIPNGCQRVEWK